MQQCPDKVLHEHGITLFHLHSVDFFFTDSTYQPMNLDGVVAPNYHRQRTEVGPKSREQAGRKKWFEGRVQKIQVQTKFVHNPKS